jgi:hypothetical protein
MESKQLGSYRYLLHEQIANKQLENGIKEAELA